ncbi:copper homeostasis protein cutC [Basidiobolus meristosporus CBS 931.73]|uniref:Copper homeostasis protein cutC homolog n=1 Tax=Basidiobolus meristosporus CBS 931.73 TaxID=1314790 RepID=A0A1Y1XTY8_9FUNG|nr:copper homeostasis protein cutC [Basidiobolus meristosporus CBS 931.73]|eukprot:ORX89183.1 copper homeostasis protein cutC [Basidiobolus meristosporus CBS 931.73]
MLKFEICIDSVISGENADKAGACRVELCDNLVEGGTTPSAAMIELVKSRIKTPVMVMIRPRGGDFCYDEDEFWIMKRDIELCKQWGVYGVVFGILTEDGFVDVPRCKELVELAKPMKVTFHRAFDMANDPYRALEDVISIGGIERILTSGQEKSVLEGSECIAELVKRAGDRIIIMPGGGVTERNIQRILRLTNVQEIHISASSSRPSQMVYRNPNCSMGFTLSSPEYSIKIASQERIQSMMQHASHQANE